jgi:ribosomal protein S12 methylthiotransferase
MGVFCYSDVENAKSFGLDGKVDERVAVERRDWLMTIQRKISARKLRKRVGHHYTALLEGPSRETELVWEARLEGMAPEIDGKLYITDIAESLDAAGPRPGDLVTVRVTEAHDYDLVGRVVEILDAPRRLPAQHATSGPLRQVATGAPLRILA